MIPEHDRDEFDFLQSERYYYLNNQDIQSENPLILLESSNKEGVAAYLKDCERDFKLCANFASDRPSLPSEPPLELEREEIYDGPTAKCLAEGRALPIDRQSRPPMPCYDFEIPDSIQWIPINKGVFIIIKKTCEFVTAFGTSYEIALKAVLKDNPLVAFLFKEHPLYPFYKFICERLSKKESVNLKDDAGVCDSEEKSIKTEDVSFNEKLHSESKTASLVQYQVSDEENSDATGGARGLKGSQEIPRSPRTTVKGCCSPSEKEQSVVIQLKKNSDKDVNNVFLDYSSESGDEKINKEAVGNKHKHKTGSVRHARADEDDRESQDSQSFGMKLDDLLEKSYQMSKKKHKHETSKSSSSKNRSRSRSKRTRKDRSSHRASKRRKRSRRRSRSRS
ncbi:uncharacterized protein LOC135146460 [Zophobas morio]|uniref:uncharacterized protein LOC135146460 n=1 Tax=Zophobas morio TaxID=2755281 RepID=UPI003083B248